MEHLSWAQYSITLLIVVLSIALLVRRPASRTEQPVPTYSVKVPAQCEPGWRGELLDHPQLKIPGSSAIQCYCPANGRRLGTINPCSAAAIDRIIKKAAEAQKEWAKTSFDERRRVLQTLLNFILDHQDDIVAAACLDTGKTKIDACFGEILVTAEKLRWTIRHGERSLRPERRPTNLLMAFKVNEVRWEPLGVVAACVSWNYPFHNLLGPIIAAIFAGNAIVVKGSENTAWSSTYFINIVSAALVACGHSPNLVQSVVCWPAVAPHLTGHPGISHLTFIGSRRVAHSVAAAAATSLTPVCAELGGKDAAIVLDEVSDLEKTASILLRGVFQNAGQNCIGIERIIAGQKIYEALVSMLERRVRELRVGSVVDDEEGVDVGAMISDVNFSKLENLIQDAVAKGARLLVGGSRYRHPTHPQGHYFAPTLLVDVSTDMEIAQQEVFAPIMTVMKAKDVDEAIAIANSTPYGLGASVFGKRREDLEKVTSKLAVGMVSVNDFGVYYAVQLPFGGVKQSGYGRFASIEGLRSMSNTKSVCRDRFPNWITTSIPPRLDYPIVGAAKAWRMCCAIVRLGYVGSWRGIASALVELVRNS